VSLNGSTLSAHALATFSSILGTLMGSLAFSAARATEVAMIRTEPRPFYIPLESARDGERLTRIRARRMGFVAVMLATIMAAPILLLVSASVF
jgi:hypothetical protein